MVIVVSSMSSQKGNVARSRPQRHQNTFSFKNDKFDKSVKTKVGTCLLSVLNLTPGRNGSMEGKEEMRRIGEGECGLQPRASFGNPF